MENYLDKSGKAMLAACFTFDNARSAEKMADINCVGKGNDAWKNGPYLSAPANKKEINHSYPYCFNMSDEFRVTAGIILGDNPQKDKNGGVKLPLPPKDIHESRVEPVISKLAIIEQFELFKEFLITFDGPYNAKKSKVWENYIEKEVLDLVQQLTDRRNQLTHDFRYKLPSIREAVEYFAQLRQLATWLYECSLTNKSPTNTTNSTSTTPAN